MTTSGRWPGYACWWLSAEAEATHFCPIRFSTSSLVGLKSGQHAVAVTQRDRPNRLAVKAVSASQAKWC